MKAYQTDKNGFLVAEVDCQPSPLEPGKFLVPGGCVQAIPPIVPEGSVAKWENGEWKIETSPVGKTYYSKQDRSIKYFDLGEAIDDEYTDAEPIAEEWFQIFSNGKWIVDTEAKQKKQTEDRINELKYLLASSDFRMLPDKFNTMTPEQQTHWIDLRNQWRTEVRSLT